MPTEWPSREQWTATRRATQPVDNLAWHRELERRAIIEETAVEPFLGFIREGKVVPSPELRFGGRVT